MGDYENFPIAWDFFRSLSNQETRKLKKQITTIVAALAFAGAAYANVTVTLEDKTVPATGYYNGSDSAGGFTSNGAFFNNGYDTTYGSWGGFSYSNKTDNTTAGYGNQYSAYAGSGAGGSANYAVGYVDTYTPTIPTITLPSGYSSPLSIAVTNTTYTALVIKNGDAAFGVDPFSGPGVDNPHDPAGDWFKLTISGYDATNTLTGSVDYFLADYRFANPAQYFIANTWVTLNLSGLGNNVSKLQFTLDSSDKGAFGINTPTYFAADNLVVGVPEPSSALLCVAGGCALLFRRRLKNSR